MPRPCTELVSATTGSTGSLNVMVGLTLTGTPTAPLIGTDTIVADGPMRSDWLPVVNEVVIVDIALPATSRIPAIEIVCTVFDAINPASVSVSIRLPYDRVRATTDRALLATSTFT